MIIYGWGNFGKRNLVQVRDECEGCGYSGVLRCYDTSRFFTLYFIPVIPLGGHHVMQECPNCKQGRWLASSKFKKLKRDELDPAMEAMRQSPANKEAVERALGLTVALADYDAFCEVALAIEERYGNDAKLLSQLGSVYSYFMMDEQAELAFRSASQKSDDPEIQQAFAVHLIETGRLDDAVPYVETVIAKKGEEYAGLNLMLAHAYQSANRHDEAKAVLDHTAEHYPDFNPKAVEQLRAVSGRTPGGGGNRQARAAAANAAQSAKRGGGRWPFLIVPGIIAAIVGIYLIVCFTESPDRVYMVNGTTAEYDVIVNGDRVRLKPESHKKIEASYGRLAIGPATEAGGFEPISIDIATSFFARPFDDDVYVINPDRAGLIVWRKLEYIDENSSRQPRDKYEMHYGEDHYVFENIEYPFRKAPREIKLDSGGSSTFRRSLELAKGYSTAEKVMIITADESQEAAVAWLVNLVEASPDDLMALSILAQMADAKAALPVVKSRLADRPVRTHWHRVYQDLIERVDPDHDVTAEYETLLESDPGNGDLMYLLARATHDDMKKVGDLLERSAKSTPPSAFGHYGLGYRYMCEGRFTDANREMIKAIALIDDDSLFVPIHEEIQLACGDYDGLHQAIVRQILDGRDDFAGYVDAFRLALLRGDRAGAGRWKGKAMAVADYDGDGQVSAEEREDVDQYLARIAAEVSGRRDAMLDAVQRSDLPYAKFIAATLRGQLTDAAALIDQIESESAPYLLHLLLYALASDQGNTALADRQLKAGVEALREMGGRDEHNLADVLENGSATQIEQAIFFPEMPMVRRVVLAALGVRLPQQRARCFELAERSNYNTDFPQMVLKDLLKKR